MAGPWDAYKVESEPGPWDAYPDHGAGYAAAEGAADMFSMGYYPEIEAAGTRAALQVFDPKTFDLVKDTPEFSSAGLKQNTQERMDKDLEQHPVAYRVGEAGGLIGQVPLIGAATEAAGLNYLSKGAPLVQRMGQSAAQSAPLGFLRNPNENSNQEGFNLPGRMENTAYAAGIGAVLPAVGDATKAIPGAIASGVKKAAKGAFNLTFGLKPEYVNEYAKRSGEINAGPGIEDLKTIADTYIGKLSDAVQKSQLTVEDAKQASKEAIQSLKDEYRTRGLDAREALKTATVTLKEAHKKAIENTARELSDAVAELQSQINKGSAESYDILDKEKIKVNLVPLKKKMTDLINEIKIGGVAPVGDDATAAVKQLQQIRTTMDQFGKTMTGSEAKQMLQQLQRSTDYSKGAGEYSAEADIKLKEFNRSLRERLVNPETGGSQEFKKKMADVSRDAGLLGEVSEFGDPSRGAGLLGNIDAPYNAQRKAAVGKLGERLAPAQGGLFQQDPNFLNRVKPQNLPEYAPFEKAQTDVANARSDKMIKGYRSESEKLPEKAVLDQKVKELSQAQEKLAPFKSISPNAAGQSNVQAALETLAKGKNIENKAMFKQLSTETGIDFEQAMKDKAIRDGFNKMVVNGARRVAAGGILGFMAGGKFGAGVGVATGFTSDIWGPKVGKIILDSIIKFTESPTNAKINEIVSKLAIPQEAKSMLSQAFRNYVVTHKPIQSGSQQRGSKDERR